MTSGQFILGHLQLRCYRPSGNANVDQWRTEANVIKKVITCLCKVTDVPTVLIRRSGSLHWTTVLRPLDIVRNYPGEPVPER